jgi:SAM-dependent methyltransferase
LQRVYSEDYFLGENTEEGKVRVSSMKRATARLYLEKLLAYSGIREGKLLEIGCGTGEFLVEARQLGFEVEGLEISPHAAATANARIGRECVQWGQLEKKDFPLHFFDVCVLSDVIEHVREPLAVLRKVHELLKPGGVIFLATPSVESWSARLMRRNWMEFKLEHLIFFSQATVENALAKAGFQEISITSNRKILTPEYIYYHFERFKVPIFSKVMSIGYQLLPGRMRRQQMKIVASGIIVLARAADLPVRRSMSIIVPVFNEINTFSTVMDSLLKKELQGLEKEIVIVESNSTDGTREEVVRYQGTPGMKIILEDEPRGKGHAVRTGLKHIKGDFVLIQDADLEYDINDYDALLDPLIKYQGAFVLGIRHGGSWKMRKFTDNPWQAAFLNLGHIFFTTLINVLYGHRLKDPFTMFKVFRRECLYGLRFECNRFDFDFELVIKLVRKGYRPVEIPVNYSSRSFSEGKKIRPFRDPLTWLWALIKFRFCR